MFERGNETRWFDSLGDETATGFFVRLLTRYDTSLLEWVKLRSLPSNGWSFHCDRPVRETAGSRLFESGYRLRAGVRTKGRFPRGEEIEVGWIEAESPTEEPRQINRRVTFASPTEVAIYALGAAFYRFLRHSKQTPGRDVRSRARRHGLYALAVFRSGHPFDPYDPTDRLVTRDALEEMGDTESVELLAEYPL